MLTDRLPLALSAGPFPESAAIAVFHPVAGDDLSPLAPNSVTVIQAFQPDHLWFRDAGFDAVVAPEGTFDTAIVCIPRSKETARAAIADALACTAGGPVLVDGQKTDGIESLLKECRRHLTVGSVISKAHGKSFRVDGTPPDGWSPDMTPRAVADGFVTVPGVFSADGIDPASRLLAASLPEKLPKRIADLGAGWGYLSRAVLERGGVDQLHLVEADHWALECARRNIDDPRAQFHWADVTRFGPDGGYDGVVMNPPFHRGRAADPGLGRAFIAAAARLLTPGGRLWMVANRHLPYEKTAEELFHDSREIAGDGGFKVIEAAKPSRGRR